MRRRRFFIRSQNTTNRWHGSTAQTVSIPAQPSSCATRKASIHWFQVSRLPPIPQSHSMGNTCSSPESGKPKTPGRSGRSPLAGGEPRRVTSCDEDCIRPFYLPEDRVVYARKTAGRFVIEAVSLAGGKPLPLTYGPANFLPTDVLRDGRILFEAAYPLGSDAVPELYTVYSDGSGVESYRCDHGTARHSGRQVSSGDVVFVSGHDLARFTSARAQEVHISAPAGEYAGEVVETPAGDWLVSWRANANAPFQLMLWTPGSAALRPAIAEQNADALQPALLAERAVPNRHPSGIA